MGQAQGNKNRQSQSEEQSKTNELEEAYWRDFMRGKSLKKYNVKILKTYHIDEFVAAELFMGTY